VELSATPPSLHPFNPKAYHALNSGLFGEVQELCNLRPVALSHWLNNVETHNRIQYSQNEISTHENRT